MMNLKYPYLLLSSLCALAFAVVGHSQSTQTEDFTQTSTINNWYYFNGACLTAGSGSGTGVAGTTAGLIPSCTSIFSSYYQKASDNDRVLVGGYNGAACPGNSPSSCKNTLPDPVGQGALRFTNGWPFGHNENGAIVSAVPFNAGQGVQITFKTVTYRGDSGGSGADGADGMSFYLIDATKFPANVTSSAVWNGLGAFGGSLGYTCSNSNSPHDGLVGGYLGLGIDEYGNFLNQGDNTATGFGYVPKRVGLRGAGSVSWAYLNATYPSYYPTYKLNTGALQDAAVQKTCSTGKVWNYSLSASNPIAVGNPSPPLLDYAPIPGASTVVGNLAGEYAAGVYSRRSATPIQYNLKITQNGLLTLSYSVNGAAYRGILSGYDIASGNAPLPASLYFGFAGSSGGSTNIHEILCFKAAPPNTSATSATTDQQLAAKISSNTQVYFSYYDPSNWTGRLTANGLVDTAGVLTVNAAATWDAQCVLTGGTGCPTTGATATTAATAPARRVMLTWNGNDTLATRGTAGIPFEWPGSTGITTAEQAVLDAGDALPHNSKRLSYLRGDTTNEIDSSGAGLFRARDGILGDIVDSSPAWVGPPQFPYAQLWKDRYVPADPTPENSHLYSSFVTAEQSRLNVVYTGANDGFLHAFRSGVEDGTGALVPAQAALNDGAEILAYMPGLVLQNIHNASNVLLDPTNPQYAHNFFVDAPPGTGDLYYGSAWHTWLVGGLGAGGAAIYALDITDPTGSASGTSAFTEANAAAIVKGEWSSATIACANTSAPNGAACGQSLGNTYGTPVIRRFHNGTWGAIFGNGYGSPTGDAGIFVMCLDPTTGKPNFYYLSAGVSTSTASPGNDGIGFVTAADLDGDHITDYVYAGDLLGNVWRFDLTSATPANWGVSGGGATDNGALFSTPNQQPITTPVTIASAYVNGSGNNPGILISFGTGQRTQSTASTPLSYASGAQNIYTVLDWNFATWNSKSAARYASLTSAQVGTVAGVSTPYTLAAANLQAQTLTAVAGGIDANNKGFTWIQCTSASACNNGVFGWYVNLPAASEQIVSPITLFQQALIVNSTIPATNAILLCTQPVDTGYTYVLSVLGGGSFTTSTTTTTTSNGKTTAVVKNNTTSGFLNSNGDTMLVGENTNLTGGLTVLTTAQNTTYYIGQSITPNFTASNTVTGGLNLPNNTNINRQTWVQLR